MNAFLKALGQTSWQVALLVLTILAVQYLLRNRMAPRWRHALWLLVLIRLAWIFPPPSSVSVYNWLPSSKAIAARSEKMARFMGVPLASAAGNPAPSNPPVNELMQRQFTGGQDLLIPMPERSNATQPARSLDWRRGLFWTWAGVAAFLAARLGYQVWRFGRRMRFGKVHESGTAWEILRQAAATFGCRRVPQLIETPLVASPALFGLWHPRLLIPAGLPERFSDDELRHVFLHECAHLHRGDTVISFLICWLKVLHWFNPFVWLAAHRISIDRELACDALVLSRTRESDRVHYGETILRLLEHWSGTQALPGAVGILEDRRPLKERIRMIGRFRPARRVSVPALVVMGLLAVLMLTDAEDKSAPQKTGGARDAKVEKTKAPTAGSSFLIHVHSGGKPVSGKAFMWLFGKGFGGLIEKQLVFEGGRLSVPLENPDAGGLMLGVIADGHVPKILKWTPHQNDPIPPTYDLELVRGVEVGGTVQDDAGRPLKDVEVRIQHPGMSDYAEKETPRERLGLWWEPLHVEKTDSNGHWSCNHYPKDFQDAYFSFQHPDFLNTGFGIVGGAIGGEKRFKLDEVTGKKSVVTMGKGAELGGKVQDEMGRPIRKAVLALGQFWSNAKKVTNSADGEYVVRGIGSAENVLTVTAPGYAPQRMTFGAGAPPKRMDFKLKRGGVVRGVVKDPSGQPLRDAMISLEAWQGHNSLEWQYFTGADGKFEWDSAPLEAATFFVGKEGFVYQRNGTFHIDGEPNEIILRPSPEVKGTVIDALSKKPVETFRVIPGYQGNRWYEGSVRRGKAGEYRMVFDEPSEVYAVKVEADGYESVVSRWFPGSEGNQTVNFELKKSGGVTGKVMDAKGEPVPGAQVLIVGAGQQVPIQKGKAGNYGTPTKASVTKADGTFQLPSDSLAGRVLAISDRGFVEKRMTDFLRSPVLQMQALGTVRGQVILKGKPAANQKMAIMELINRFDANDGRTYMDLNAFTTTTDENGNFEFDKVPPGERVVYAYPPEMGIPFQFKTPVSVKPGETQHVTIKSRGRPVIGKVVFSNPALQIEWPAQAQQFSGIATPWTNPKIPDITDPVKAKEWWDQYYESEGYISMTRTNRNHSFKFKTDGTFSAEDVEPGEYDLTIQVHEKTANEFQIGKQVAYVKQRVTVPSFAGEWSNEPFDVGVITMAEKKSLKLGESTPGFSVKTLAGKDLKLDDFKGKYVLVDFWATWCGPCVAEQPNLKSTWEKFKDNPKFSMVGLSLDRSLEPLEKFVKEKEVGWTQAWLGDWQDTKVPEQWGVEGIPSIFLINPEGKIEVAGLRGAEIEKAVGKVLGK